MTPLTPKELTDFYPTLLISTASGALVGLISGLSDSLIRQLPNFLRASGDERKLNYLAITRYTARQITFMMLLFSLSAYPIYSSDIMPKDEINTFIIQQALFFTIFFPVANIIESFVFTNRKQKAGDFKGSALQNGEEKAYEAIE